MKAAEILSLVSIISFAIAAVTLVLAVFFWFKFKISSVIGDLSGRTAKKSIAKMRADNERTGKKNLNPVAAAPNRRQPAAANPQPPRVPAPAPAANRAPAPVQPKPNVVQRPETGVLQDNKAGAYETVQTELLGAAQAAPFLDDENATMPLVDPTERTVKRTGGKKLVMLDEVMLIHTDEVI